MRIISGKYRGKRLLAPDGRGTRPTSDKVRESIFDILSSAGPISGNVLDLFAGTGALGIEALSRGASDAVFVEKNPAAAAVARKNLSLLGIEAKVFNTDWKVAVRKLAGRRQFDIIFLDPPYANREEDKLIKSITDANILAPGGYIVVEHAADSVFAHDGYEADHRRYSDTGVTFLRKNSKNKLCVFPGTFDPFTLGHRDIVLKALENFEKVIVAVAETTYREKVKPLSVRRYIAEQSLSDIPEAAVDTFGGMLTDYLRSINCSDIVRGTRNDIDVDYEARIAEVYKKDMPDIRITYYEASHPMISSHAVRDMALKKDTDELKEYVCENALKSVTDTYSS